MRMHTWRAQSISVRISEILVAPFIPSRIKSPWKAIQYTQEVDGNVFGEQDGRHLLTSGSETTHIGVGPSQTCKDMPPLYNCDLDQAIWWL